MVSFGHHGQWQFDSVSQFIENAAQEGLCFSSETGARTASRRALAQRHVMAEEPVDGRRVQHQAARKNAVREVLSHE